MENHTVPDIVRFQKHDRAHSPDQKRIAHLEQNTPHRSPRKQVDQVDRPKHGGRQDHRQKHVERILFPPAVNHGEHAPPKRRFLKESHAQAHQRIQQDLTRSGVYRRISHGNRQKRKIIDGNQKARQNGKKRPPAMPGKLQQVGKRAIDHQAHADRTADKPHGNRIDRLSHRKCGNEPVPEKLHRKHQQKACHNGDQQSPVPCLKLFLHAQPPLSFSGGASQDKVPPLPPPSSGRSVGRVSGKTPASFPGSRPGRIQ